MINKLNLNYNNNMEYRELPPLELLNGFFNCDFDSGKLTWKVSSARNIKVGDEAGCLIKSGKGKGYRQLQINGICYKAHRIIWYMYTGEDPKDMTIDHINTDNNAPLEKMKPNNVQNLRRATNDENLYNQKKSKNNTSGYKGISAGKRSYKNGKFYLFWLAKIDGKKDGKVFYPFRKCIKRYEWETSPPKYLIKAIETAREKLHGEFYRHE